MSICTVSKRSVGVAIGMTGDFVCLWILLSWQFTQLRTKFLTSLYMNDQKYCSLTSSEVPLFPGYARLWREAITFSLWKDDTYGRGEWVGVSHHKTRLEEMLNYESLSLNFSRSESNSWARAMPWRSKTSADIAHTDLERLSATMLLLLRIYSTDYIYSER